MGENFESIPAKKDFEVPQDSGKLHYGEMRSETFGGMHPLNPDEVEKRGRDITDKVVGKGLKGGFSPDGLIAVGHFDRIVAVTRDGQTLTAYDITEKQARDEFYSDMNHDEREGVLSDTANYRVFTLSDEDYAACLPLQQ